MNLDIVYESEEIGDIRIRRSGIFFPKLVVQVRYIQRKTSADGTSQPVGLSPWYDIDANHAQSISKVSLLLTRVFKTDPLCPESSADAKASHHQMCLFRDELKEKL